jgi:hypothetical protein
MSIELLHQAITSENIDLIEDLLKRGTDASATFRSTQNLEVAYPSALVILPASTIDEDKKVEIAKLLLCYNAHSAIVGNQTLNPLIEAVKAKNIPLIQLFLEYGFDPADINCYDLSLESDEQCKVVDRKNNPYLKIDDTKYIIYIKKNNEPYVFGSFVQNADSFLYTGRVLALFIEWCAKNNLLVNNKFQMIDKIMNKDLFVENIDITEIIQSVIGDNFTLDDIKTPENIDFNENEEMYFIEEYLSLTKWKYNFYNDLQKLYTSDNKIVKLKKNSKVYAQIFKLLDLRYKQYQNYWVYTLNSNQNKEEIEALINGRESSKRVVEVSVLEDLYTPKPTTQSSNIIPDDFMK